MVHVAPNYGKLPIMSTTFHTRLKERIEERGTNPSAVSKAVGGHNTLIRDTLERASSPRIDTVAKIASYLETSVAYLIGETDDPSRVSMATGAIPTVHKSHRTLRLKVTRMNAGPDIESGLVSVSLDVEGEPDEAKLLLTYDAAVLGSRSLGIAADRLDEHQKKIETPSA